MWLKKFMKEKVSPFIVGNIVNFIGVAILISLCATDINGDILVNETTDIPVFLYFFGIYAVPWLFANYKKMNKPLKKATFGLFGFSHVTMLIFVGLTEGIFTPLMSVGSILISFVFPLITYYYLKDHLVEEEKGPGI